MQTAAFQFESGHWSVPSFPALDSDDTMVLVFGAVGYEDAPDPLVQLTRAYPRAKIAGCSSAGEIHGPRVSDDTLSVVVVRFDKTRVRLAQAALGSDSAHAGAILAKQLAAPDLRAVLVFSDGLAVNGTALLRGILKETSVPAHSLRIELTESTTMDPKAIDTCSRLAALGVHLYLDDFGTGYSSLSYLTRMPIHALKVDRSFVARLTEDPMSASIVQTILTLATALGMEAIAEGVETNAQAEALRRMGCAAAQGYLWHRPLDPARALAVLQEAMEGAVTVAAE